MGELDIPLTPEYSCQSCSVSRCGAVCHEISFPARDSASTSRSRERPLFRIRARILPARRWARRTRHPGCQGPESSPVDRFLAIDGDSEMDIRQRRLLRTKDPTPSRIELEGDDGS